MSTRYYFYLINGNVIINKMETPDVFTPDFLFKIKQYWWNWASSFQGWQATSNITLPNSDQNEFFVDLESTVWEINRLYPNAENIAEINKIV